MRRGCAIGAAILVGAIGVGLALLNRIAGGDGEIDSPAESPEPIGSGNGRRGTSAGTGRSSAPASGNEPNVSTAMTKAELYEVASELGIKGRSSMNKAELLEAIRAAS